MTIKVEDLRIGDEIIVPSNSKLKYLKVLSVPRLGTKPHWQTKLPTYTGVKCSGRRTEVINTYVWGGKTQTTITKVWECTPDGHNVEIRENLNYKTIWLVNRK